MKKHFVLVFLFAMFSLGIFAQQEVQIGEYRFVPEQNMKKLVNSKSGIAQEALAQDNYHVLVQFSKIPTLQERSALQQNGVNLGSYLKGNAYYATISKGASLQKLSELNLNSIVPIRSEWKTDSRILKADVPDYAKSGNDIKAVLYYSKSVSKSFVENYLAANNYSNVVVSEAFNEIRLDLPTDKVKELAKTPWIKMLTLTEMPKSLFNTPGRTMTQGNLLTTPPALNGRGLSGKGVKVGVWDGDVESHVDYGNRIHQQEFEMSVGSTRGHGMHVSGTIAGAGVLDPDARGNAPKAELYTYNFNTQSNGLNAQEEMRDAREQFGINQTQNSYGLPLGRVCQLYNIITYNATGGDRNLDQLVNMFPTLTHVFAAGNDQGACGYEYGSSGSRTKNVIFVGAANKTERITSFSSYGPMDDGRLIPHVTAFGQGVYSTVANNKYGNMDGTSMSCPNVSGIVALIIERYKQLNNNAEPLASLVKGLVANTAKDKGRKHVDFQYGYGIVNAEKAVQSIENKWFATGNISNGDAPKEHTITVPKDVKQLRVMLVWSDTTADKQYVYGEPALINNLDLEVENGGTTTYPWVLDPKNPKAVATRGVDNINNIEQVTIDDPSQGNYTVKVKATEVVSSKQEYSVVYFFEKPEFRLTYPNGGELLTPGESIVMHTEYSEAPVDVEISYDNGKTYTSLAKEVREVATINIPEDAPLTAKALLRVSSGKMIDVSDAPFTIMSAPQNLKIELPECGTEGWKLSWDKIKDVTKYEVLKAEVDEGTFSVINVANDTTYTLQQADIDNDKRNVFSVRVKTGDGVGKRAKGVLVNTSQPVVLSAANLPFSERFVEYPSKYIKVTEASSMSVLYQSKEGREGAKAGEHFLGMVANVADTKWDATKPFDSKNKVTLTMCNLDLSSFSSASADKIHLSMNTQFTASNPQNVLFKVLINGQQVSDLAGDSVFFQKESFFRKITIDLSPYKGITPKVEMVFVSKISRSEYMIIDNIDIYVADDKKDIELFTLKTAKSGLNLSDKEEIEILVENKGIEAVSNIPVGYQINDKAPVFENITKEIKPNEQYRYKFYKRADLTTAKDLGEMFNLKVMAALPEDANRANDTLKRTIVNYGKVFPHPESDVIQGFFGPMSIDPKVTKTVDSEITYTDVGGALLPYLDLQKSTLRFVPADKDKAIEIVFSKIDIDEYDKLSIFNKDVPSSLDKLGTPTEVIEKVTRTEEHKITSQASDGSITLQFQSDRSDVKQGWVAKVKQVKKVNTLTLAPLNLETFYASGEFELEVKVTNNTADEMKNVRVAYQINGGTTVIDSITKISGNSQATHTFAKKVLVPVGNVYQIDVAVLSADADFSDNTSSVKLINDKYCHDSITNPRNIFMTKLSVSGKEINFKKRYLSTEYRINDTLTVHKNVPDSLLITVNKAVDTARIVAWVDWNGNGNFSDQGEQLQVVEVGTASSYKYGIKVPEAVSAGQKRLRIAVLDKGELEVCKAKYAYGHIADFTLDVKESYPVTNDLALLSLDIKNGKGLTSAEPIKVKIRNNGSQTASNFNIAYKIGENAEVSESVSLSVKAFEEKEYTFTAKADFSQVGKYDVKVYLKNNDSDAKNDTLKKKIYSVSPSMDPYFALAMKAGEKPVEYVNGGTLNGAAPSTFTYEAWIKPEGTERNTLFDNKGVYAIVFEGSKDIKQNAIAIIVGENQINYTTEAVIEQGKWQHVAITGVKKSTWSGNYTFIKIMVNGKEVKSKKSGSDYVKGVEKSPFVIAPNFNGMIDEVRVWDTVRTENQIKEGMYKHLKNDDGTLPQNLLAEFSFDEGPGNLAAMSAENVAPIRTKRAAAGPSSIWQQPSELLGGIAFDQQVEPAKKTGEDEWTVVIHPDSSMSKITGKLIAAWDSTVFKFVAGSMDTIKDNTAFDFSSGDIMIVASSSLKPFGRDLSQSVTIYAVTDKSSEADLLTLSFTKANNSELSSDVNVTPIAQTMTVDLTEISDLSAVVPTFTASTNAKVTYLGNPLVSGTTQIDLTQPVVITVESENGRYSKNYVLSVQKAQSITWTFTPGAYKYGQNAVQLDATASSNLPVRYVSDNNNVASVNAAGELLFSGVGMANITAMQDGGNSFAAATPVTKQIAVGKADLTAKIQDLSIKHTEALPTKVTWNFATLVAPEDEAEITLPAFEIENAGSPALPATGYLTTGTYDLAPKQNSLATPHYAVTFEKGSLTVGANSHTKNAVFAVTDGTNAVEGATIKINGTQFTTDVSGNATVALIDSATFAYEVSKTGYETVKGKVVMARVNQNVAVSIGETTITLSYTAGANGQLIGETTQKIAKGGTGKAVNAAPNVGYRFLKWSDEKTDNPRIDANVQSNVAVSAEFEAIKATITYIAGVGGSIEGTATQEVNFGAESQAVKAVADAGYYFAGWNDGNRNAERKDIAEYDVSYTANFLKYGNFPFTEDFENGLANWINEDKEGGKALWEIGSGDIVMYSTVYNIGTGNYVFFNSDTYGSKNHDIRLTSKRFLIDRTAKSIKISFDYQARLGWRGDKFFVRYSTDGGQSDVQLLSVEQNYIKPASAKLELEIDSLPATAEDIEFTWQYKDRWGYLTMFDNVKIENAYEVTFNVTDGTTTLSDAQIVVGNDTLKTDTEGKATLSLVAGTYAYEASKEGYPTVKDSIVVTNKAETVTVELLTKYPVTFVVTDGTSALADAKVVIGTEELMTNAEGKAVFELSAGTYEYKVIKDGYVEKTASVEVSNKAEEVNVVLEKQKYLVTFNVVKGEQGIAGVSVLINSATLTTDAQGKATIKLANGEYDYKVNKEGMSEKTGKVTVNNADTAVTVSYTGINDELGRGIAIYPNPFSERLLIKGTQAVETVIFSTLSGQVVKIIENNSKENQLDINLSELNSGTYLLQLRTASGTVKVQKVVKE